jgi:predicted S18 family serine protease
LEIRKKLAADDPKNTQAQRDLMISYWEIGDVQSALKNSKNAFAYYQQALVIAEAIAAKDNLNKQAQNDLTKLKELTRPRYQP